MQGGSRLETGGLDFSNNYAFNPSMVNMPRDDFTVEFWAKTPAYTDRTSGNSFQSFFSYATHTEKDSTCECTIMKAPAPAFSTHCSCSSQIEMLSSLILLPGSCCML